MIVLHGVKIDGRVFATSGWHYDSLMSACRTLAMEQGREIENIFRDIDSGILPHQIGYCPEGHPEEFFPSYSQARDRADELEVRLQNV